MHLIVVENEPTSLRGGQELNLLEICRGLAQRGHNISLLYTKEGILPQFRQLQKKLTPVLDGLMHPIFS